MRNDFHCVIAFKKQFRTLGSIVRTGPTAIVHTMEPSADGLGVEIERRISSCNKPCTRSNTIKEPTKFDLKYGLELVWYREGQIHFI
jgi:hypothetical protein